MNLLVSEEGPVVWKEVPSESSAEGVPRHLDHNVFTILRPYERSVKHFTQITKDKNIKNKMDKIVACSHLLGKNSLV